MLAFFGCSPPLLGHGNNYGSFVRVLRGLQPAMIDHTGG
jgi:hypothetical protein